MREYNTLTILRPDISDDVLVKAVDRIRGVVTGNGGKVVKVRHLGTQRLAYDIAKSNRGVYVEMQYVADPSLVHEVERNIRMVDAFVRFQTRLLEGEPEAAKAEVEDDDSFAEQIREARIREEEAALAQETGLGEEESSDDSRDEEEEEEEE